MSLQELCDWYERETAALKADLAGHKQFGERMTEQCKWWRERCEKAEADRDRLKAAVGRVKALIDTGPTLLRTFVATEHLDRALAEPVATTTGPQSWTFHCEMCSLCEQPMLGAHGYGRCVERRNCHQRMANRIPGEVSYPSWDRRKRDRRAS